MIASLFDRKASLGTGRNGAHRLFGQLTVAGALAGIVAFAEPSLAAPPEDITGVWLTDDGEGGIEIRPCGESRCGRVAWMKDPKGSDGKPPVDSNNPDASLRARPICGLQIITGLKPQADGSWGQGKVYNPDTGKTYDMEIRRQTADMVKVTGYMGFKLLGQSMDWKRAPKNLGGCNEAPPKR